MNLSITVPSRRSQQRRLLFLALAMLSALWGMTRPAAAQMPDDGMQWLQRAARAAQNLTYTGTFVYRSGTVAETSRITHLVDAAGEAERIEVLDGSLREVVRIDDEVKCYLPENRTVVVEQRSAQRGFPARQSIKSVNFGGIGENYTVRKGAPGRVAGMESQLILIEPRDSLRYGQRWWIDIQSGLLVKAILIGDQGEPLETFTFSELRIGGSVDRASIKPSGRMNASNWLVRKPYAVDSRQDDGMWQFRTSLPGFHKVSGMKRQTRADVPPGSHWIFSDGLAAVSVFIDPLIVQAEKPETGLFAMGAVNVYKRILGDNLIVVMGDVPHAALRQLGDGIEARRK